MIKVKILGVELEADLLNPDIREKYENYLEKVKEQSNDSLKCEKVSESIRMQCNAVIESIDGMFGEGSSKKVLGENTNLLVCLNAFEEFCEIYNKYADPVVGEAKRRAREKAALK